MKKKIDFLFLIFPLYPIYQIQAQEKPNLVFIMTDQWKPEYEADKAIEYLNGHIDRKQPFSLVVSMNPLHTGYGLAPDKYKEIYKPQTGKPIENMAEENRRSIP